MRYIDPRKLEPRRAGNAIPISMDMFDEAFPGAQLDQIKMSGQYVSENINRWTIRTMVGEQNPYWTEENGTAVIINAPTGRGKNYMVLHELRALAAEESEEVIYLCNRAALNEQQVLEAVKAVNPIILNINLKCDVSEYKTGSITIMTYHQFYASVCKNGEERFQRYKYCVFDEAHFFFSDALFNENTGVILKLLPKVFQKSLRIYMTATPENVLAPIYSVEMQSRKTEYSLYSACYVPEFKEFYGLENLPKIPMYTWDADYSCYQGICVFSGKQNIINAILEKEKGKWIIFVNDKETGKEMQKTLQEKHINTLYVDRDSRTSSDFEIRKGYEKLVETGKLNEFKVLITTSVLDNGFSIHDKEVRHIVLFSDERTEFLQELGRVRMVKDQKVKIYIAKMTKQFFINEARYRRIINTVAWFIGNKNMREYPFPDAEIEADPLRAEEYLAYVDKGNGLKGIIQSRKVKTAKGELARQPCLNDMARWNAIVIKREIDKYNKMLEEASDTAPVEYKLRWLADNKDLTKPSNNIEDLDIPNAKRLAQRIDNFMGEYEGQAMEEPENGEEDTEQKKLFLSFSKAFYRFYEDIFPKDSSLNSGIKRQAWKHRAIQNHLSKLKEAYLQKCGFYYHFEKSEDGFWCLQRFNT